MSARKFRLPPSPPSTILWITPQQLADIRLQYEIGEMVSGHRSPYRSACHDQRDATRKGSHVTSDG